MTTAPSLQRVFSEPLLAWFDCHGRKDLPWQHPRGAYRVWISEVMLQQTQVKTVIPYFNRFIENFPDVWQLAQADEDKVLAHWSGLGYYSRARNLLKTAKIICTQYDGIFPHQCSELAALPGIGLSTAAAIVSQAFNLPAAVLDGNVKRVLCRYFMIEGWTERVVIKNQLWQLANHCMPQQRCADYTQAIMDLGATCCTLRNPGCTICPLKTTCKANLNNKVLDFPHKKPKKTLPLKKQQFLLIYNSAQQIYLEKKPPVGLWGGLWCLPSVDISSCPATYIRENYAINSLKIDELINIRHSFSHFHLEIKALAIKATPMTNEIAESDGRWFKLEELKQLGIAKPVSTIIKRFQETQTIDIC